MAKTFLHGNVAYRYVGLARHLYQKLPEGQKKIYQIGQARIEVCKVNPFNYIRIRAEEVKVYDVALFFTYSWYKGEDDYAYLQLEFWRVRGSGEISILFVDMKKVTKKKFNRVVCGRFSHVNPLECYVYLEEVQEVGLWENIQTCPVLEWYPDFSGWTEKSMTSLVDRANELRVYRFRFHLDFEKKKWKAFSLGHYAQVRSEYTWNLEKYCPEEPVTWTFWGCWWYALYGSGRDYRYKKYVFDIFPAESVKELYLEQTVSAVIRDIVNSPDNPIDDVLPGSPCPPSSKDYAYWFGYIAGQWKSDPRYVLKVKTTLNYGAISKVIEEDSFPYCTCFHLDLGGGTYDFMRIGDRNLQQSIHTASILNQYDFVYVYYRGDEDTKYYISLASGKLLDTFEFPESWFGRHSYKSCQKGKWWANPDDYDVKKCYRWGSEYPCEVRVPILSLLSHENICFAINPFVIVNFSYLWGYFDVRHLLKKSFFTVKDDIVNPHSKGGLFLAYKNPLGKESDYYGVFIPDDIDYGYSGLGFSNPILYAGAFFLPFTKWELKLFQSTKDLDQPHFPHLRNGGAMFPNQSYRDYLVVPPRPDEGFFVGEQGAPDGVKDLLEGSSILLDILLLQKGKKEWYINGEQLKYSFDEKKLLGG